MTVPVGLFGLHSQMIFVRGPQAAMMAGMSKRYSFSGTLRSRAPITWLAASYRA